MEWNMNFEALWGNPFSGKPSGLKEEISFLSAVPFFDLLGTRQKKKIYSLLHHRTFSENEIIFRKGDPGVGMYIIRVGGVAIYNEFPDLTRSKIVSLNSGDFFGEIALLNDSPRSATVISTGETVLLCLFRHDLLELMDSDPVLSVKLVYRLSQIVSERLRLNTETRES